MYIDNLSLCVCLSIRLSIALSLSRSFSISFVISLGRSMPVIVLVWRCFVFVCVSVCLCICAICALICTVSCFSACDKVCVCDSGDRVLNTDRYRETKTQRGNGMETQGWGGEQEEVSIIQRNGATSGMIWTGGLLQRSARVCSNLWPNPNVRKPPQAKGEPMTNNVRGFRFPASDESHTSAATSRKVMDANTAMHREAKLARIMSM